MGEKYIIDYLFSVFFFYPWLFLPKNFLMQNYKMQQGVEIDYFRILFSWKEENSKIQQYFLSKKKNAQQQ